MRKQDSYHGRPKPEAKGPENVQEVPVNDALMGVTNIERHRLNHHMPQDLVVQVVLANVQLPVGEDHFRQP